jgi:hypothetical protein
MRKLATILFAIALAGAASGAVRHNARWREYRRSAIGRKAVGGSLARAAVNHLRRSPREWGTGPGGFAKRAVSALGQHVVKQSIQAGVAALHHENLRYRRSNLRGTWPRMKYAAKSTFVVPRTNRRGKTVALGRISGAMGAGMISRVWQPASAAGLGAGVASGGISLGAGVGMNMAREFWPRKQARTHTVSRRTRLVRTHR